MSYRIVKGTVSVDGKSPDGDTIAFTIDTHHEWMWPETEDGRFPQFNSKYQANIRFEAIDALELHYSIQSVYPGETVKQPIDLAKQARDRLLDLCGFDRTVLVESNNFRITDPKQQKLPVTLAYNGIDPFGRIIGFVFTQDMGFEVSDKKPTVLLTPEHVSQSINAQLLREGHVYPTFYNALYPDLRKMLSDIAVEARSQSLGLWKHHQVEFQFDRKPGLEELETLVMMPKLFRRLSTHIAQNGAISNFREYLRNTNDMTVDTREVRLSDFSSFVRTKKLSSERYQLWLSHQPETLVFLKG
ncbi:MAG: hypothetical protein AAB293_06525 [Pseudomonadota bacterium]